MEKQRRTGFHGALRELVLTERGRSVRQGRWSVRRWAKSLKSSESASPFPQ